MPAALVVTITVPIFVFLPTSCLTLFVGIPYLSDADAELYDFDDEKVIIDALCCQLKNLFVVSCSVLTTN